MLFNIILMVVSYAISYASRPKPKHAKPASMSEFEFPQIDESTPQSVVFGDVWVKDWFVLGVGNLRTTAIRR
jgi:hypothetical protein